MESMRERELFLAVHERPRDAALVLDEPVVMTHAGYDPPKFHAWHEWKAYMSRVTGIPRSQLSAAGWTPFVSWIEVGIPASSITTLGWWDSPDGSTRLVGTKHGCWNGGEHVVCAGGRRSDLEDRAQIARTIDRIFDRHARGRFGDFIPHLPTSLDLHRMPGEHEDLLPSLESGFRRAVLRVWQEEILERCEDMERFPEGGRPIAEIRHERMLCELEENERNPEVELPIRRPPRATPADFERWWSLVTSPIRFSTELNEVFFPPQDRS